MPMGRRARQQLLLTLIIPLLFVPFLVPSLSSSNLVNVYVKVYCYTSQGGTTIALPGALVSIYTTNWALVAQAQTNSSGVANFTLPKGKYFIVASADGYYPKKTTIWLKKSSKEVNINLVPKPPLLLSSSFRNITVTLGEVVNIPITLEHRLPYPAEISFKVKVSNSLAGVTAHLLYSGVEVQQLKPSTESGFLYLTLELTVSPSAVGKGNVTIKAYSSEFRCRASLRINVNINSEILGSSEILSSNIRAIHLRAGDHASLNIELKNPIDKCVRVNFSISHPQGWNVSLVYSGLQVEELILGPRESLQLSLEVGVPFNASAGAYPLHLRVSSNYFSSNLTLLVDVVAAVGKHPIELQPISAYAESVPGSTTEFQLVAVNNLNRDLLVALSAISPSSLYVDFLLDGKTIRNLYLKAGEAKTLTVRVKIPDDVKLGLYNITVAATASEYGISEKRAFKVNIIGYYDIVVYPKAVQLQLYPGEEEKVTLTLTNKGTLSSPSGTVSFEEQPPNGITIQTPSFVEAIPPSGSTPLTLKVKLSQELGAGSYVAMLKITVGKQVLLVPINITVKQSTFWVYIPIALLAAIFAVLAFVMYKFGRR